MKLLDFLKNKRSSGEKAAMPQNAEAGKEETPAVPELPKEPYMSTWYTYGNHAYRSPGEDSTVYFIDEARNLRKKVVDNMGYILDFPGIQMEDFWAKEVPPHWLQPQIRFRTDFSRRDGKIMMLWQVQPDGRYWADSDGYGMEPDEEVTLYAFLTEEGTFDGPFRIYRVGIHKYYQE